VFEQKLDWFLFKDGRNTMSLQRMNGVMRVGVSRTMVSSASIAEETWQRFWRCIEGLNSPEHAEFEEGVMHV